MTAARLLGRGARRAVRLVLALAAAVVLLGAPASVAEAHSGLLSSTPGSGVVVAEAPEKVTLRFSESVTPVPASFRLFDPSGAPTTVSVTSVDSTVEVMLPADLAQGSHVLSWRVISADSHPISGAVPFSVGQRSEGAPLDPGDVAQSPVDGAVSLTFLLAQVTAYLGLLTAVGLTLFHLLVLRSPRGANATRERTLLVSVAAAIVAHAALVPLTLLRSEGLALGRILDPGVLLASLGSPAALALALVVLGCCAMLLRPVVSGTTWSRVLSSVGLALAVASVLPVGHTRTATPTWLVMTADLVHTATAALWLGGVLGLALFLRAAQKSGTGAGEAADVLSRFSTLAGLLVLALGVTGVLLAVLILGSVPALFETNYGRTLLVKLAFVAVIALLAWWNKTHLVPAVRRTEPARDQWRRLTGAVRDEAALLLAVVCVTGLLVMQSPVGAAEPGPSAPATVAYRSALGTGAVQGTVTPARIGENNFDFDLRDSSGAAMTPADVPEVSVTLRDAGLGPLDARVKQLDRPGRYRATVTLPTRGDWELAVTVRVDKFEQQTARQLVAVAS